MTYLAFTVMNKALISALESVACPGRKGKTVKQCAKGTTQSCHLCTTLKETTHKNENIKVLQRACDLGGGVTKMADKLRMSKQRLYYLINYSRKPVPVELAISIEKALDGQVTRAEIRPDIFGD